MRIDVGEYTALLSDGSYSGNKTLSNATGLLALSFLVSADVEKIFFNSDGSELTVGQIDDLKAQFAQGIYEIIKNEDFSLIPIGFTLPFAGTTGAISGDYLLCDGTMYARVDYPLLYDVLDTAFIVDVDNFVVPDLNEKFPLGTTSSDVGTIGGSATHALTVPEMPAHEHRIANNSLALVVLAAGNAAPNKRQYTNSGALNGFDPYIESSTGGVIGAESVPHNNMPPFQRLRYYIKAQ